MDTFKRRLICGLSILIVGTSIMGCTDLFSGGKLFKERAAEAPPVDEYAQDKSFFVNPDGTPKSFLCAWAPEIGRGSEAFTEPFVNQSPHCNIEFEITENYLVGKLINPSFPDDRNRWKQMLQIPITKHYYYEKDKDSHGRETNVWIENASRSHWSARPKMKLDLGRISIYRFTSDDGGAGEQIVAAKDIEWDQNRNFLGFSIDTSFRYSDGEQSINYQATYRVNFLKFDHDPSFVKVPFHQENAQYLNILHVMGRRTDGIDSGAELYAGHWDLRKPTRVYISGAPSKEVEAQLVRAVWKWNHELRKVGAIAQDAIAFQPVVLNLTHPFDLRYPSITWIEDRKISTTAPLGIGMAHADVRNGQILWGGVVLFGGMLEKYINAYAPAEASSSSTQADLLAPFQSLANMFTPTMSAPQSFLNINMMSQQQMLQNMMVNHKGYLSSEMALLGKSKEAKDGVELQALTAQMQSLYSSDVNLNTIVTDVKNMAALDIAKVNEFFTHNSLQGLLGDAAGSKIPSLDQLAQGSGQVHLVNAFKETDATKRNQMIQSSISDGTAFFQEKDMTIENLNPGFVNGKAQKTRTYPEMLDSVVSSLILHEFGHFMGMGHQFKENIVPEIGTVPSKYIKDLAAKATKEKDFTNYSSVMGYQSGETEIATPAEEVNPGPHDDLVLRYLYKGEYPSYDPAADDWVYTKIPESGKIPLYTTVKDAQLKTAYFPACNDYEASLGADPFCNRWDRGSSAVDIVTNYFEELNSNLLANLYSLTGAGGNEHYAQYLMWKRSLDTFGRVRLFYDEMRRRLRSDAHLAPLWNQLRNDTNGLFDFAKACDPSLSGQVTNSALLGIFKDASMLDLCRANSLALKEFEFFLNLPAADYTRIDHNNRYVNGGYLAGDAVQNWGHIFGSWYELSNVPLKFSALYTLTSANSYIMWGGYINKNPFYDNEENRFLYRTLYPAKFTEIISSTVQNNMRFAATGKDDTTTMGRTVLAAGQLLPWQRYASNDAARLPREFNDMLDQQTKFNFSIVAVLIEAATPDATSTIAADHYKKFTATIYDFVTNKSITAQDVFLLPNGDVFAWAPGMFLYPVTKTKFYKGTSAYAIAYKVDYDQGPRDPLAPYSLKLALMEKHIEIGRACVNGFDNNGLSGYFNDSTKTFNGFAIPAGIGETSSTEMLGTFYDSLTSEFSTYETWAKGKMPSNFPISTMRGVCDESLRGIGQISAAAAMLNGFWLSITPDYLEK